MAIATVVVATATTFINLSLAPFLPTTGLECRLTTGIGCRQVDSVDSFLILAEEQGVPNGRMVVVRHAGAWGSVQTQTPSRSETVIDLANYQVRLRIVQHIRETLPDVSVYGDTPIERIRELLLRSTTAIAMRRGLRQTR